MFIKHQETSWSIRRDVDSRIGLGSRRSRNWRGVSALELALILPMFLTIILGCVDFARFAYTEVALTNAVRAGGAWAMLNKPSNVAYPGVTPPSGWVTSVQTAVSQEMSLQPGFQSSSLIISTPTAAYESSTSTNWKFTITATYPFNTLVTWNFSGYGIPRSMTIGRTVTMRGIR